MLSRGCFVPTSFLTCIATLLSSSLSKHRKRMNEVGYPTIFSASDTTLVQLEGDGLEKMLRFLRPMQQRRDLQAILKTRQTKTPVSSACSFVFQIVSHEISGTYLLSAAASVLPNVTSSQAKTSLLCIQT